MCVDFVSQCHNSTNCIAESEVMYVLCSPHVGPFPTWDVPLPLCILSPRLPPSLNPPNSCRHTHTLTLAPTRAHTHTLSAADLRSCHDITPHPSTNNNFITSNPMFVCQKTVSAFFWGGKKTKTKRNRHSKATSFWIYSNCRTATILSTCWLFIICSIKHNLISCTPLY